MSFEKGIRTIVKNNESVNKISGDAIKQFNEALKMLTCQIIKSCEILCEHTKAKIITPKMVNIAFTNLNPFFPSEEIFQVVTKYEETLEGNFAERTGLVMSPVYIRKNMSNCLKKSPKAVVFFTAAIENIVKCIIGYSCQHTALRNHAILQTFDIVKAFRHGSEGRCYFGATGITILSLYVPVITALKIEPRKNTEKEKMRVYKINNFIEREQKKHNIASIPLSNFRCLCLEIIKTFNVHYTFSAEALKLLQYVLEKKIVERFDNSIYLMTARKGAILVSNDLTYSKKICETSM